MKFVLTLVSLLISTQAFAKMHTELTDKCLAAAEQEISDLGSNDDSSLNQATIDGIYLAKKNYVEVSYSRAYDDSQITGEAALTLQVFKFTRDGDNVKISGCKVLKAEILDERAD